MADDRTPADDETPQEPTAGEEQPTDESPAEPEAAEEQAGADEEPAAEEPAADEPAAPDRQAVEAAAAQEPVAEAIAATEEGDGAEQPAAEQPPAAAESAEQPGAEQPPAAAESAEQPGAEQPPAVAEGAEQPAAAAAASADDEGDEDEEEPAPRVKPEIPGADLEVDIVTEGTDLFGRGENAYDEDEEPEPAAEETDDAPDDQPIAAVTIDLAAGARYRATGKRKTAVARVTLRPGDGSYVINGRTLDEFFPRGTLQRNIRQPLEAVGYETRMDVVARMHGGGVSAQAGALRHGISRALLEADPNLRGELKRRGFLTRDPRVKERKKAGLKKARKRPQFSKR
jgi:small subunit ribosomal protein S9